MYLYCIHLHHHQVCLTPSATGWSLHSHLLHPRHHASTATLPGGDTYILGGSYSPTTRCHMYQT